MDYTERIKSFILGLALPLLLAVHATPFITGQRLRTPRGHSLSVAAALGWGLSEFGIALGVHAFFFVKYDNHPVAKYIVVALGVLLFFIGVWLVAAH